MGLKRQGFAHKHRIHGEGTVQHFHGGGQNHEHSIHPHSIRGARWIYVEPQRLGIGEIEPQREAQP